MSSISSQPTLLPSPFALDDKPIQKHESMLFNMDMKRRVDDWFGAGSEQNEDEQTRKLKAPKLNAVADTIKRCVKR